MFYTKNRSTTGPVLVEASVQNSVIFSTIFPCTKHFFSLLNLRTKTFFLDNFHFIEHVFFTIFSQNVNVKVSNAENGESLLSFSTEYPNHLNAPHVIDASCKTNKKGDFVCRILLSTDNAAVVQLQSGMNLFQRIFQGIFSLSPHFLSSLFCNRIFSCILKRMFSLF